MQAVAVGSGTAVPDEIAAIGRFANQSHHHVGGRSIEDLIGVDLIRVEIMGQG